MEPVPPQGAYYMMVKHNRQSDVAVMQELLEKGVAVAPGVPFYRPGSSDTGFIRAHFALSADDLEKVEEKLAA
jgi:aspartate/methionine/tyrosine aminotransferase